VWLLSRLLLSGVAIPLVALGIVPEVMTSGITSTIAVTAHWVASWGFSVVVLIHVGVKPFIWNVVPFLVELLLRVVLVTLKVTGSRLLIGITIVIKCLVALLLRVTIVTSTTALIPAVVLFSLVLSRRLHLVRVLAIIATHVIALVCIVWHVLGKILAILWVSIQMVVWRVLKIISLRWIVWVVHSWMVWSVIVWMVHWWTLAIRVKGLWNVMHGVSISVAAGLPCVFGVFCILIHLGSGLCSWIIGGDLD